MSTVSSTSAGALAAQAASMPHSRLMVLLFSDIVGSTDLKSRLGTVEYAALLSKHDQIFREIIGSTPGASILKDTGDGFFASFSTASDAARAALRFQYQVSKKAAPIQMRIGLHVGEVAELERETTGLPKLVGLAADVAARLMALASPGQILMTRVTFNDARQFVRAHPGVTDDPPPDLRWIAHGEYLFKGAEEPVEVFEVGAVGIAPLAPPHDGEKAYRNVRPGDEVTLGWRPAGGLEMRHRPHWIIKEKLGEGGFGEVWLAEHEKTGTRRVYKFCFEPQRLRGLKREVVLFRLLKEALGDRRDIARIIDFQFDENPYFIETEFYPDGTLHDWAMSRGGLSKVPLGERVGVVAKISEALAAAHSVGVLHKDLKPSNILMRDDGQGFYPVLTDFGIGIVTDRTLLQRHDITAVGFTQTALTENQSSRTGTRIYAPPESMLNMPFTVQGDVYALGVLLYQMVVGDLNRPLAEGWERDVGDPLLRQDISVCVEGDPKRRLGSAQELASRLSRLGERRAIHERELDAARLAARRSRLIKVLAATVVVVLGLAIGMGAALRERSRRLADERTNVAEQQRLRRQAEQARDQVKSEAEKAAVVSEFLKDMLTSADPARTSNPELKVREVLDRAARQIDADQKMQPEVEAAIRAAVGRSYLTLGLFEPAEKMLTRAVDVSRKTQGMTDRQTLKAFSDLGVAHLYKGQYEQAEKLFNEALRLRTEAFGPQDPDTADSLFNLSLVYGLTRRFKESDQIGRQALAIREKVFGAESKEVAASLQYLAQYVNESGNYAAAEPLYVRSLELREKLLGSDHFEIGNSHNNLGLLYLNTGKAKQAQHHFSRAVEILVKSLGDSHPNVGMAKTNLANTHVHFHEFDQARPLLEDALRIGEKTKGPNHPDLLYTLYGLGTVYYSQQNYPAAEMTYQRALSLAEKAQGPDGLMTIVTRRSLGLVYRDHGKYEQAEPLLVASVDALRKAGNENEALPTEVALIECLIWAGKFEQAEPMALSLYDRGRKLDVGAQRDRITSDCLQLFIRLYEDWEKPQLAEKYRAELSTMMPHPQLAPTTQP